MAQFTGTLNVNEFYNSLFNAYRLITTFADGLDGLDLFLGSHKSSVRKKRRTVEEKLGDDPLVGEPEVSEHKFLNALKFGCGNFF